MKALGMQRTCVTVAMMMSLLLSAAACRPRAAEQSATDDGEATGQAVTPALGSPDNTEGHGDIAVLGTVDYLWDAFSLPDSVNVVLLNKLPDEFRFGYEEHEILGRVRPVPLRSGVTWLSVSESDVGPQLVHQFSTGEYAAPLPEGSDYNIFRGGIFVETELILLPNVASETIDRIIVGYQNTGFVFVMPNWLAFPQVDNGLQSPRAALPGIGNMWESGGGQVSSLAGIYYGDRPWLLSTNIERIDAPRENGSPEVPQFMTVIEAWRCDETVQDRATRGRRFRVGPGRSPVGIRLSDEIYVLALRHLGPPWAGRYGMEPYSIVAYESSDMEDWSAVAALAIDDDDVLKLAACRLDETTDRVAIFLQKAGGVLKLVVLDGALGERLCEWEFTSPELAEAIAADIEAGTNKIDVAAQDGTVYAFWDQKIGDSTRDLMYVLWQPDVPPGPEKPQAGPDISATSLTQTDPAGDRDASS